MSDIIIIGGGLTGLSAAFELEKMGIAYTLIEVKGRLGSNIISEKRDGFVLDGGPFVLNRSREWPLLDELGLGDALYQVAQLPKGNELVAFKDGTQTLVDTLVNHLKNGRIITRMSVSTLGKVENRFAVCLENGMVMNADGLIVAAPARYAERMFYTFQPEISQRLLKHHYDSITRVTLGYRKDQISVPFRAPEDPSCAFGSWTDSEYRVPPGHILIQVGVRLPLERTTPEIITRELQRIMDWPTDIVVQRVDYWPESHSLMPHNPSHDADMAAIEALLPEGVALVGSDYRADRFEDRMDQGRAAARKIAEAVKK